MEASKRSGVLTGARIVIFALSGEWPISRSRIAYHLGKSEPGIVHALKQLVDSGILVEETAKVSGAPPMKVYTVTGCRHKEPYVTTRTVQRVLGRN